MSAHVKGIFAALALSTTAALNGVDANAEVLKLRISVEQAPGVAGQVMLAHFRDELKKEMGDAVEIEYFDSGQLGDEIVHMEQLQTGQIDIVPLGSDVVTLDPKWAVFDIPFLFDDAATVHALLDDEIGEELRKSLRETAGIHVLGFGEVGFRHVTNNVRPVVVPADLAGLKMRVPGSPSRLRAFEAFGANPITMSTGELYLAFQQGTVDGHENTLSSIKSWSFHEVQDYVSLTGHVYTPVTFGMNARRWDSLTDEQKAAIERVVERSVAYSRQYAADSDKKLLKELADQVEFNEVDRAAFVEAAKEIWPEIAAMAGGDFGQRVIDAVQGTN